MSGVAADLNVFRAVAASLQASARKLENTATILSSVDLPVALATRKRCVAEAKVVSEAGRDLLRMVRMYEAASAVSTRHAYVVPLTLRWRPPTPYELAQRIVRRALRAILGLINDAKEKYAAYEAIARKAKRGVFYGNFAGADNIDSLQGPNVGQPGSEWVPKIRVDRYLPGGGSSSHAWPYRHKAVDPLDLCAAKHDLRYKKMGITATSQFSVAGLAKTATTNLQMATCAGAVWGDPDFNPRRVDRTGVKASDAAVGIAGLFGLMGAVGTSIATLAHKVADAVPGVDFQDALKIINTTIGETVKGAMLGVKAIQLVVP